MGQLGQMLIGVSDVFVAGRHSTEYLAAVGLAMGIIAPVFVVGLGFLFGTSAVISRHRGEGKEVDQYLFSSIIYSLGLSLLFILLSIATKWLVPYLGFEQGLVPLIQDYILYFAFSFLGAYVFQVLREFLQGKEDVIFANFISIATVGLNVLFCFILVFGYKFIPALGIKGLALGSILARVLAAIFLLIYSWRFFKSYKIDWIYIREVFSLSWPIAISILVEVGAFSFCTIMIGRMGLFQAAAHNIVINLTSVTFMVPLAISTAIAVKISYAYGQKNYPDILRYTKAGLTLSLLFMSCTGLSFYFIPNVFSQIFTDNTQVIQIVATLLIAVALFQIFDGTQICLAGALRGVGHSQPQAYIMFLGYWVLGLPLGWYLANIQNLYAFGFWLGLALALSIAGISMLLAVIYFYKKIKKECVNIF